MNKSDRVLMKDKQHTWSCRTRGNQTTCYLFPSLNFAFLDTSFNGQMVRGDFFRSEVDLGTK